MSTSNSRRSSNGVARSKQGERTNPLRWGDLSNVPPSTPFKRFLWEKRVWVESTFALSMLEPWEKLLVFGITILISGLLLASIYLYLPHHLNFIQHRARFYLLGEERAGSVWKHATTNPSFEEL